MNDRHGYRMTEIGEIPDDWEIKTLDETASQFISGGTPSTSNPDYWNGEIPWMRSAWINKRFVDAGEKYISEKGLKNSATNLVPRGSLLVATRVCIGNVALNNIDIAISQDLTGIVIRKEKAAPEYVYWALKNSENRIKSLVQGSTIGGVLREDLRKLRIPIPPSVLEQQKIALVVSTVDDAIQKTDEIIAKTQQLKKGLMQQLLTRGIGHTKFKQTPMGGIPEEWEVVKIKDIIEECLKNGLFVKNPKWGSGVRFLNVVNTYDDAVVQPSLLQRVEVSPEVAEPFLLKEGDIVFVRSSLKREGVAQACMVGKSGEPMIFDCHLIRLSVDRSKVDPRYLVEYCRYGDGKRQFIALSNTTTMTTIHQENLAEFRFLLPPLEEQQRIAAVLSDIDTRVDIEKQRRNALDKLKKGLMQVLLTGKVRVKVS
jgi:type I restriction enzyme S subunit